MRLRRPDIDVAETISALQEYLLDEAEDKYSPSELLQLELQLVYGSSGEFDPEDPKGLVGWSLKHDADDKKYAGFSALPYHRRHKLQRIDQNKSSASKLVYLSPRKLLVPFMAKKYIETMGPRGAATLEAFENTPAYEDQDVSVAEALGQIVMKGESVVLLVPHAEGLEDIGTIMGAIAISLAKKRTRLIRKAGTILGKTLAFEKYLGKPVTKHFKFFANLYLTVPDTDSADEWDIPEEAAEEVRRKGMRAMARDISKGAVIATAPTGSAMYRRPGEGEGPTVLELPEFSDATPGLITMFQHYLIVAAWGDKVSLSFVESIPRLKVKGLPKAERERIKVEYMNKIRQQLAQKTSDLSQLPVIVKLVPNPGEAVVEKLVKPQIIEVT